MGYQPSSDEGSGLQTQGFWAPTDKARRANADGRARRVYGALAKPASPAWVSAQFHPSRCNEYAKTTGNSSALQSPEALAHKKRASKLSAGFKHQILEQLAEDRARMAQRLHILEAACSKALEVHSTPEISGDVSPGDSSPKHPGDIGRAACLAAQPYASAVATSAATDTTVAILSLGLPLKRTAVGCSAAMDPKCTPQRTHTPPTTLRRAAVTAARPRRQAPSITSSRRVSSPQRRAATAAAGTSTPKSVASTGAEAITNATTTATETGGLQAHITSPAPLEGHTGARRRLSYKNGDSHDAARPAASGSTPVPPSSSNPSSTAHSGTAMASAALAAAPHAATAAAVTQRCLAAMKALSMSDGALGPDNASAAAVVTPPRLAWQAPVDLLPPGSLAKFADVRDGAGPRHQETYMVRQSQTVYDAPQLDHRERFRVGMAELNAELYSSWRALVDSGAV